MRTPPICTTFVSGIARDPLRATARTAEVHDSTCCPASIWIRHRARQPGCLKIHWFARKSDVGFPSALSPGPLCVDTGGNNEKHMDTDKQNEKQMDTDKQMDTVWCAWPVCGYCRIAELGIV